MAETETPKAPDDRWLIKLIIVAALVGFGILLWLLPYFLLVTFAAIIVATILGIAASVTERFTPLRGGWARAVSWLLIAALIVGFIVLLGTQIQSQFRNLVAEIPGMLRQLGALLGIDDLQTILRERLEDFASQQGLFADIANVTTNIIGLVGTLILVLVAGIFLALNPEGYRRGVLMLVPEPYYNNVKRALDNAARALRLWLIGTLIAMLLVGVVTTAALYAIGLESALALGIIAGVLEFIPFLGPILSVVPAILVALPEGYGMVLWVLFIYLAIQQIEGNVLVPIIQHRTADLPPVLGILSIVAFTVLLGLPGVILGVPLTLVLLVLVKQLYVRDLLGRDVQLPGENNEKGKAEKPKGEAASAD